MDTVACTVYNMYCACVLQCTRTGGECVCVYVRERRYILETYLSSTTRKHTTTTAREMRDILPLLRLRPLCQGPVAQPPAAKATNLYKYS